MDSNACLAASLISRYFSFYLSSPIPSPGFTVRRSGSLNESWSTRLIAMPVSYAPLHGFQSSSSGGSARHTPSPLSVDSPSKSLRALELADPDETTSHGRVQRSNTITSLGGFDFRDSLLPLTLSGDDEGMGNGRGGKGEEKHVGLAHGSHTSYALRWS